MINTRYTLSKKRYKNEQKYIINKIKKKFRKEAKEINIDVMKLDKIITSSSVLYNPYKYNFTNKRIFLTKKYYKTHK
ncbi:MAG: hypothetical protein ACOCRK_02580 [bacterium]